MSDCLGKKIEIDGEIYNIFGINLISNELLTIKGSLTCGVLRLVDAAVYELIDHGQLADY